MKVCIKCGIEKEEKEFATSKRSSDGITGKCKTCLKEYYAEWKKRDPIGLKAKRGIAVKLYNERNKEKIFCRSVCWRAIKKGILVPKPCRLCGSTKDLCAHHDNYLRPLDVIWYCRKCHDAQPRARIHKAPTE